MKNSRRSWLYVWAVLALVVGGGFFLNGSLLERNLNTLPYGLIKFSLSDAPPKCARWKDHMPAARDQKAYRLYIEARKVWRSKIAWQLTYAEATRILTDVRAAAEMGDWGARALMAQFYLFGLGVLESNHVLDADPAKAIEITRKAAAAMLPWGLYDLGVAYEHGYGGVPYDAELAWAYYLKAAQLGSPEAQMTLAGAYANDGRLDNEELMTQCAYQQGHGPAALALGVDRRVSQNFKESISFFNEGVWRRTGGAAISACRRTGRECRYEK